jgi:hypothetical protein
MHFDLKKALQALNFTCDYEKYLALQGAPVSVTDANAAIRDSGPSAPASLTPLQSFPEASNHGAVSANSSSTPGSTTVLHPDVVDSPATATPSPDPPLQVRPAHLDKMITLTIGQGVRLTFPMGEINNGICPTLSLNRPHSAVASMWHDACEERKCTSDLIICGIPIPGKYWRTLFTGAAKELRWWDRLKNCWGRYQVSLPYAKGAIAERGRGLP